MSEVRYRGLLRRVHADRSWRSFEHEFVQFTGAVLESHLPLVDQFRMIFACDDLEISRYVVHVAHSIRIDELAPDLIRVFTTVDSIEGQFIKNAILLALDYLRHDNIHAFMLDVMQSPGELTCREIAAESLNRGKKRPEMALHFFHMAEDISELTDMRCHAIEGLLYHGGGPRVLSLLVPFLQDHSGEVRWTALRTFEKHGDVFFASAIKPLINDDYQGEEGITTIGTLAQKILTKWASQA